MTICWRRILQAPGAGGVDDLLEARVVEGMVVVDTPSPISGTLQPYRHPSTNGGSSLGGLCRLDCGCSSSGNGWARLASVGLALDFGFNPMRAFNRCLSGAAWAAQDDWAVAVEDDGETAGAKDLQTPCFGSKDNGAAGERRRQSRRSRACRRRCCIRRRSRWCT